MAKFSVILAAAGQSSRFRDPHHKKPFALLEQKPVWLYSAEKFLARNDVRQLIMVLAQEDRDGFLSSFSANIAVLGIDLVNGGAQRHESVLNGMCAVRPECDFVAVHDAARPVLTDDMIEACFSAAVNSGAAIPAIPVTSTLKRSPDGRSVEATVERAGLYMAQTPQVFRRDWLESAYQQLGTLVPTDEAQVMEHAGHPVTIVEGSPMNIKITTRQDLRLAAACLKSLPAPKFDARPHPFADDNLWR